MYKGKHNFSPLKKIFIFPVVEYSEAIAIFLQQRTQRPLQEKCCVLMLCTNYLQHRHKKLS